jgi:hypothetical protein
VKIFVRKNDWSFGLSVLFVKAETTPDSPMLIREVGKMTFEKVEGPIPDELPLHIREQDAQMLMDELWQCGLRPSEGSGSAGAMAATQEHLKDMRRLVFDFPRTINFAEPKS